MMSDFLFLTLTPELCCLGLIVSADVLEYEKEREASTPVLPSKQKHMRQGSQESKPWAPTTGTLSCECKNFQS